MPMDDWNPGDFYVELDCEENGDVTVQVGYETTSASCYDVDPDHAVDPETLFDYLIYNPLQDAESELRRVLSRESDDEGYEVLSYCDLVKDERGEWKLVQTSWDEVEPEPEWDDEEDEEDEGARGREPEEPKAPVRKPCYEQAWLDALVEDALARIRSEIEGEGDLYDRLHREYLRFKGPVDVGGQYGTVMFDGEYFREETLCFTIPRDRVVRYFLKGGMAAALSNAGYCSDEREYAERLFRLVLRMDNEKLLESIRKQLRRVDRDEFRTLYPEFEHLLPQA